MSQAHGRPKDDTRWVACRSWEEVAAGYSRRHRRRLTVAHLRVIHARALKKLRRVMGAQNRRAA